MVVKIDTMNVVALPLASSSASVRTGAFAAVSKSSSRARCVRRSSSSHPVTLHASASISSPTTFTTARRRATTTTTTTTTAAAAAIPPSSAATAATAAAAAVGPVFELAARVKAPFHSPYCSEALAALVLATALVALLGRDDNNLLLATVTYRAMSVGSIVQWWLGPTGHAVAFGVLAVRTFLAGGIRVVRRRCMGLGTLCENKKNHQPSCFFSFFFLSCLNKKTKR